LIQGLRAFCGLQTRSTQRVHDARAAPSGAAREHLRIAVPATIIAAQQVHAAVLAPDTLGTRAPLPTIRDIENQRQYDAAIHDGAPASRALLQQPAQ
jgi:hypothetical protein